MISERDPARARERDAGLLAQGGGAAPTFIRQDMIPGLSAGLIARGAPLAGQVLPQPVVTAGTHAESLLDDLTGPCFRLVVDATCDLPALHAHAAAGAIRVVVVGDAQAVAASDAAVLRVSERDGMLRRWLQAAGCHGALVRPDHYVFGAFATVDEAEILLEALACGGFAASMPTTDSNNAGRSP